MAGYSKSSPPIYDSMYHVLGGRQYRPHYSSSHDGSGRYGMIETSSAAWALKLIATAVGSAALFGTAFCGFAWWLHQRKLIDYASNGKKRPSRSPRLDFAKGSRGSEDLIKKYGILFGVRVIDMGTHIAGSSLGRVMADLGAEVIKVEPITGDPGRNFYGDNEERDFDGPFELTNLGKYSFSVSLSNTAGIRKLKNLLHEADVFINNMQISNLHEIELHYEALRPDFPHLVYAHLSPWGDNGKGVPCTGMDAAAFFGCSGISGLIQGDTGDYLKYPFAAGDLAASQALLSGVMSALVERVSSGLGQYVSTSLLHCGSWCAAPYLLSEIYRSGKMASSIQQGGHSRFKATEPRYISEKPEIDPCETVYRTADGEYIAVVGLDRKAYEISSRHTFLTESSVRVVESPTTLMAKAFGVVHTPDPPLRDCEVLSLVQEVLSTLRLSDAMKYLDERNISYHVCNEIDQLWKSVGSEPLQSKSATKSGSSTDKISFLDCLQKLSTTGSTMHNAVKVPYVFSGFDSHCVRKGAPRLGEDTDAIIRTGWLPRPDKYLINKCQESFSGRVSSQRSLPLSGYIIVELIDFLAPNTDLCVSAASRILMKQGAMIIRIEPKGAEDRLRLSNPRLSKLFNEDKEIRYVDDMAVGGVEEIHEILQKSDCLLTNFTESKLRRYDLDGRALSNRFPRLVLAQLCDHRVQGQDDQSFSGAHGALASLWAASGICTTFGSKAISPPKHVLSLMTSFYLAAGVSIAAFHQARTNTGQAVRVAYDNVGYYISQYSVEYPRPYSNIQSVGNSEAGSSGALSHILLNRTKDGIWFYIILPDIWDIRSVLSALRIDPLSYISMAWLSLKVFVSRPEKKFSLCLESFLYVSRQKIAATIGKLSFTECMNLLDKGDVLVSPVQMPSELAMYGPAHRNGIFETMSVLNSNAVVLRVTSPVRLER